MFTGFASENTPAIQVWDFFRPYTGTATVSLADDCAPIQYFRTGATTTAIDVYLPSAPIEGKQITIVNARYGASTQTIKLYSSDARLYGTSIRICVIGAGQSVVLCYSKNLISFGTVSGSIATGWMSLNQTSIGAANYNAAILGGDENNAPGSYSSIVGGAFNTTSGQFSGVISSSGSTASGNYSSVVGGTNNTASGQSSIVAGGETNAASGTYSAILGGSFNTANATNSFVLGGQSNTANSNSGIVAGGRSGTTRLIQGNTVLPASAAPISATAGVQQLATLLLGRQTTDATATVLTSNTSGAATTNQVILPNNSAYFFQGQVIAGVTGAGDTKGWYVEGVIKRGANAASTALVGTPSATSLYADTGAATWSIAVTADTTNGGLAITVTGAAATTIRWVAQIRTTEMTF